MQFFPSRGLRLLALLATSLVAGCAVLAPGASVDPAQQDRATATIATSPWVTFPGSGWEHYRLPGKRSADFRYVRIDDRDAVAVRSESAASMLRRALDVPAEDIGRIRFSWKVPALIDAADLAEREKDDAPVRIVLAFDGDRSQFSTRDTMLSELARAVTGEEMPYATLMYVWCNKRPAGETIMNPRTGRIRKLVVESGVQALGQWRDYERDVRADFERVFGEPPGRLIGVAIMTDTDNTRSRAKAWYGPVSLVAAEGAAQATPVSPASATPSVR